MALEPAGISLQAQGFKDYVRQLDAIDKKQREAFEAEFKGTGKSFAQITKAAKDYENELKRVAQEEKQAADEAEKLAQAQVKAAEKTRKAQVKAAQDATKARKKAADEAKKLAAAQKTAAATQVTAFLATAQAALSFTKQVATAAFELGKLGAQFQGQQIGLSNLAGSFGQSGSDIQRAIQKASKGSLSGLQAIQAANQGLLLGVAKTPEEFAKLTNSALVLGRTLGLTGTQAIEQFTSALGRRSLLILDNFGISASQVNAEIERLAQADFGKARSELTEAQKQATFMKASLKIAGEAAATIGDEAGEAQASFDRLTAAASDFKTQLGEGVSELNQTLGLTDFITKQIKSLTETLQFSKGVGPSAGIDEQIKATEVSIKDLESAIERIKTTQKGGILGALFGGTAEEDTLTIEKLEQRIGLFNQRLEDLNLEKAAEDQKKFGDNTDGTTDAIETSTEAIKAFETALKSAQNLQLSFARAGEDAALKQARATEDLALKQARAVEDIQRKQAQQVAKLDDKQAKDRDKLLNRQVASRAKFEASALKQIKKAEANVSKERKKASDDRLRLQKQIQDKLKQQEERFRLSQLQSERRFQLADRRLRAEGDILGLQQLREDQELKRQEEKENFELSKGEAKKEGRDSLKEQDKNLKAQQKERKADIDRLKSDLAEQRAEQLSSFDKQFSDLEKQQTEAQAQLQAGFIEQAAKRAIALQRQEADRAKALEREEEDRRISQRRQLEDLGIALAEQKDVTAQGVNAIAEEIERVFGMSGVANNIIVGFSERTRSEFNDLAESVEKTISDLDEVEKKRDVPLVALTGDIPKPSSGGGFGGRISGPFQDGGVVPGPIGSPQIARVEGGETILPTHQRSFTMAAPVIPSQSLEVIMSGGFNISGDGQSNDAVLQAATKEMTENFKIAVRRLARRN